MQGWLVSLKLEWITPEFQLLKIPTIFDYRHPFLLLGSKISFSCYYAKIA